MRIDCAHQRSILSGLLGEIGVNNLLGPSIRSYAPQSSPLYKECYKMTAYEQGRVAGYSQGYGVATASHWDDYIKSLPNKPEDGWVKESQEFQRGFQDGVISWKSEHPYTVLGFGSHPDSGNDDCWMSQDFTTYDLARQFYLKEPDDNEIEFLMLDGPEVNEIREVQRKKSKKVCSGNDEWVREGAMQAGMAFGVEGYNDYMGY